MAHTDAFADRGPQQQTWSIASCPTELRSVARLQCLTVLRMTLALKPMMTMPMPLAVLCWASPSRFFVRFPLLAQPRALRLRLTLSSPPHATAHSGSRAHAQRSSAAWLSLSLSHPCLSSLRTAPTTELVRHLVHDGRWQET